MSSILKNFILLFFLIFVFNIFISLSLASPNEAVLQAEIANRTAQNSHNKPFRKRRLLPFLQKNNKNYGPGDHTFFVGEKVSFRKIYVHVPSSYNPKIPMPLILNFHGGGGSPEGQKETSQMDKTSDEKGFIVAYPQGSGKNPRLKRRRFWNPGSGPDGMISEDPTLNSIDDYAFVNESIDILEQNLNIDSRRIYATGFSNGGILSHGLACRLSHRIAAIASVAGPYWTYEKNCKPKRPVSILHFHGTADRCAPYLGGPSQCHGKISRSKPREFRSAKDSVKIWQNINQCPSKAKIIYQKGKAICFSYGPCNKDTEVILCSIKDAGHTWPGGKAYGLPGMDVGETSKDINANEFMWNFFKKNPLPKNS